MPCAIWYRFYILKNVKNTHGGVYFLKLATLLKVTLPHEFFTFLNCKNGTKSCKASHLTKGVQIATNRGQRFYDFLDKPY